MAAPYHPPVKHSLSILGHRTSISLEPLFWELLHAAAEEAGLPLSTLVAQIDAERIRAETPPGLASAIRIWLVAQLQGAHENGAGIAPDALSGVAVTDQ
ncbi:aryl-sulfate sulfotransferase [Erythrobacter sp. QSSC1-22B]|uniref:ribbon-helix-helix domain-containing protein n=1 Tax=Erythrobacter sp. QSSC1-22B TaxID=1860125 RepID=UPI0008051438|nr:ribbon-helix-helix domain-containing protein [Erythrobacter sp. QSSC1-22B]OBX18111.1 aryl-sulfate sulfotransferase [Erythrobacter sp. QSSC1-22B]